MAQEKEKGRDPARERSAMESESGAPFAAQSAAIGGSQRGVSVSDRGGSRPGSFYERAMSRINRRQQGHRDFNPGFHGGERERGEFQGRPEEREPRYGEQDRPSGMGRGGWYGQGEGR